MHPGKHQTGFTIIELMMAITLMAVILAMAAPSFSGMIADTRLTTTTNSFISAVTLAKSEAISRKVTVHLSAQPGGNAANEWGTGWIIWIDADPADNTPDYPGEFIRVFPPPSGGVTADSTNGLPTTTDGRATISFMPNGLRTPGAANIDLFICDDRSGETGRQITISIIGRTSLERSYTCDS